MVRLTEAIVKAQGQTTSQPRRPRSSSQSKLQDQQQQTQASTKQAPICITGDKLSLNYAEISSLVIDRQGYSQTQQKALAFQFAKVKKLFLSHNNLRVLDGIANFPNLTHLSLSHNRLVNIDELAKIGSASAAHGSANNASKLLCLAIKGNYFLERHPDYKALVIRHFVNLRELDSQPLQAPAGPSTVSLRAQIREGIHLKNSLIPFLLKMEKSIGMLALHLDSSSSTNFEKIELVQRWNQLFNHKDYMQRGKIPSKVVQATQLREFIKFIDGSVLGGDASSSIQVSRSQLQDLFEWLYQEIILKLSTELKSTDLVKYLNFTILQKNPQLADYLNVKHQVGPSKQFGQLDQRQVERLCTLLERDPQISLEMLLAEQLNAFYELQPELSSVQDYSSDIKGGAISVIQERSVPRQSDNTGCLNSTPTAAGSLAAVIKDANVTPSPNTTTNRKRLLVENSGSSFDHPLILKSQQELEDHSMAKNLPTGSEETEVEFSFRGKQQKNGEKQSNGLQKFSQAPHDSRQNQNEQSFLVASAASSKSKEARHHESPVRRTSPSPAMKSFFKIKQSAETEILPARPPASLTENSHQPLLTDLHQQKVASLKMNIPKNYFNAAAVVNGQNEKNLGPDTLGQHSRGAVSDSFQLSGNDPIIVARGDHEALPDQQVQTQQGKRVLARFLETESDQESLGDVKAFLRDKVLTQFPIFALNEDYMRAVTIIIMEKIERAQTLIKQISVQIYPTGPVMDATTTLDESSVLEQPVIEGRLRKQLTSEEKQKLSLIKKKLQEKKERSRSVTFNDSTLQSAGHRCQSKDSNNSRDSCFSPVNRRRDHSIRSRSRGVNNSQQPDRGSSGSRSRVFGSELLREQTLEHKRLTDEQNAQLWVQKKQIRSKFALKMKKIVVLLELAEQRTVQQAYYHWLRYAQKMHHIEHYIRQRQQATHREKAFYFWMAAFKQSFELTSGLRALQTKQKVWYHLDINRKQAQLNRARVETYCRQKLLLKSFYGFLKILELHREERRKAQQEKDQSHSSLQSLNQTDNIYKRRSSSRKKQPAQDENSGLGLINVRPVIDKRLNGVYDLSVVDMKRQCNESKVSIQQPLLNAVRSQPTFGSDLTQTHQQVSFCENGAYTNTLVQQVDKSIGSAYFTKQVNFFKSGSSKTFVQATAAKSGKTTLKSKSRSRSGASRDQSFNSSKRSILKKVYGNVEQTNTSIRWGLNNTTTDRQLINSSQTEEQTLEHSFGKLMSERAAKQPTSSSRCIEFEDKGAQTSINTSIQQSKKKRSRSRSGLAEARANNLTRGSTEDTLKTELSSYLNLRTAQMNTTQARTKARATRLRSRSADKNRLNCGNLSRSIQDQKPKSYEKTTASYVSKFISGDKQGSSQMFRHLKNTTMGGNGDFFRGTTAAGEPSASTKKQYRKMLVK